MSEEFNAIRPFHDGEVSAVLERLKQDKEFLSAISKLKFAKLSGLFGSSLGWLLNPLVRWGLARQFSKIASVEAFQLAIEPYLRKQLDASAEHLSVSGLEQLDINKRYVFISNHRDIAMDPAMVNWQLHQNGHDTLRIAIGDNLLSKPYVSDLMRLNKSFIVQRSASSAREKFKAAKLLSNYIYHSVVNDKQSVWIAQREGRAKNGYDLTNQAVLSMIMMAKPKNRGLGEYLRELNIVPVAISYEFDPCDLAKAVEVIAKETEGDYEKSEHEDVQSIAAGIEGQKGDIHVHFGQPLDSEYESIEEVTAEIDTKIHGGYVLHLTNILAWQTLYQRPLNALAGLAVTAKALDVMSQDAALLLDETRPLFNTRISTMPEPYRTKVLQAYAKPVDVKLLSRS